MGAGNFSTVIFGTMPFLTIQETLSESGEVPCDMNPLGALGVTGPDGEISLKSNPVDRDHLAEDPLAVLCLERGQFSEFPEHFCLIQRHANHPKGLRGKGSGGPLQAVGFDKIEHSSDK